MIDIHSHILQGVDDGSEDLDMSIGMARMYLDNGIEEVIATPHYIEKDEESLSRNTKALKILEERLEEEAIPLKVYLGNEVYISMEVLEDIKESRVATLNGSRYVLLEFPMREVPIYAENVLYELLVNGYIPIIAHPERYIEIQKDPNILFQFLKNGALAQLNLPSLEGLYGRGVKETAELLVNHRMIQFVGTDSHTDRRRSPKVEDSLIALKNMVSREQYRNLTYENASNVLKDKEFVPARPIEYVEKKSFFSFLGFGKK